MPHAVEAPGSCVFGRFRGPSLYMSPPAARPIFDFDQFVSFYFDRPLLAEGEWFGDAFQYRYRGWLLPDDDSASSVAHLARACEEAERLAERFGFARLSQGFNALLIDVHISLFLDYVPLDVRLRAIRSMLCVFRDVVAPCGEAQLPGVYFMWWDTVRDIPDEPGATPESDACLATLIAILGLPRQ